MFDFWGDFDKRIQRLFNAEGQTVPVWQQVPLNMLMDVLELGKTIAASLKNES